MASKISIILIFVAFGLNAQKMANFSGSGKSVATFALPTATSSFDNTGVSFSTAPSQQTPISGSNYVYSDYIIQDSGAISFPITFTGLDSVTLQPHPKLSVSSYILTTSDTVSIQFSGSSGTDGIEKVPLVIKKWAGGNAAAEYVYFKTFDNYYQVASLYEPTELTIYENRFIDSVRSDFREFMYLADTVPSDIYETNTYNIDYPSQGMAPNSLNIERIDSMFFQYKIWDSYMYRIIPSVANGKIALVANGHGLHIWGGSTLGQEVLVDSLLNRGYEVYYGYMILNGGIGFTHDSMELDEATCGCNPIAAHIDAWIKTINFIKDSVTHDEIYMMGISGGWWLTSWVAALDERVDESFGIASGYPLWVFPYIPTDGDYEHDGNTSTFVSNFYYNQHGYEDIMVMAATNGRVTHQLYNPGDPGFARKYWQIFKDRIEYAAKYLGGELNVFEYYHPSHYVDDEVVDYIMNNIP